MSKPEKRNDPRDVSDRSGNAAVRAGDGTAPRVVQVFRAYLIRNGAAEPIEPPTEVRIEAAERAQRLLFAHIGPDDDEQYMIRPCLVWAN